MTLAFIASLEGEVMRAVRLYRRALLYAPGLQECQEQLHVLLARTQERRGLLDALAMLAEFDGPDLTDRCALKDTTRQLVLAPGPGKRGTAVGKALLLGGLGHWHASLSGLVAGGPQTGRSLALLELVGHSSLNLGQSASGLRMLRRFLAFSEVSGLPMLHRQERLRAARRALLHHAPKCGPVDSPSP
jgi:hypothetical protein